MLLSSFFIQKTEVKCVKILKEASLFGFRFAFVVYYKYLFVILVFNMLWGVKVRISKTLPGSNAWHKSF